MKIKSYYSKLTRVEIQLDQEEIKKACIEYALKLQPEIDDRTFIWEFGWGYDETNLKLDIKLIKKYEDKLEE